MSKIPREIEMFLEEISERLGIGRAVVMIGAGFSKNADKTVATNKQFLNWNELGDVFYNKIYGKAPEKKEARYLDAMKLASIVESIFGRPTLDKILLDYLPDEEFAPGELHKQLLSLNWADVFTTNYDTLLERTRTFIPNRRYQVVLNVEDLVYSFCPRIIKLHGSFPSYRPFVIAQEDYRRYPKDSAVFVNTVQQALIENILCLIGFSGDDPNFLNWIGWIRDNLGANYNSKIYLITVEYERKVENVLLSARNITVLNLADCFPERKVSYKEALGFFFKELQRRQGNDEQRKWIGTEKRVTLERLPKEKNQETQRDLLLELYNFWENSRQNYPGWIIAPHRERCCLEKSLIDLERYGGWELLENLKDNPSISKNLPSIEKFLQLYDWMRQVCLLPLTEKMIGIYNKVLEMEGDESWKCELRISLLTYYRQMGAFENFYEQEKKLSEASKLTEGQKKRIRCEKAMFSLYRCEYEQLDGKLAEWPPDVKNFSYELMHIGLMWEGEQYQRGLTMLVSMLDSIRSIEGSGTDIKIISQEAYALNLLKQAIPQAEFLSLNNKPIKFISKSYYIKGNREEILKADRCDPENEMELFRTALAYPKALERQEELYHISTQFINFLERTGNFMVVSSKMCYEAELKSAIEQIIRKNFYWGMILSVRTRDDKFIRQMAGRGALYIDNKTVDYISGHFCKICRTHIFSVIGSRKLDEKGHRYNIWGDYLPIILGGLLPRCKPETREKILVLAGEMVEMQEEFQEFCFLAKNMYCCLTGRFMVEHGEKLLEFIMKTKNDKYSLEVLTLDYCDFMLYDMQSVKKSLSKRFYEKAEYLRKLRGNQAGVIYVETLLYHMGVFNDIQAKWFVSYIENNIKKIEFPLDSYSYVYEIVKEKKDLIAAVKKWLLKKINKLSACMNSDSGEYVFQIQLFEKIMRLFKQYQFSWNTQDVQKLIDCLDELEKRKSSIEKKQYYFLFSNYYRLLFEMLWKTKMLQRENRKEWLERQYLVFTKKLLWSEKFSTVENEIFDGIYGKNEEYFIVAVCFFQKYLQKDKDLLKIHLKEIEINLATVIREQGILAPFCIESLGMLVNDWKRKTNELDIGILQRVLQMVYRLETKSNFLLLQKVYGAKLAYNCSIFMQKELKLKDCVDEWKAYVDQEGTHALITKQWRNY